MFSPSRLLAAAMVLAAIASPALAAPPRCTPGSSNIRERKEWRTLTVTEKQAYFRGMDGMIQSGFYDELANTHNIHNNYIHGNPMFLPWHRAFTVVVEVEMRKYAGEQFALPYWDWGYDSQAPELGPMWGTDELSIGRGADDRNGCVRTGHFRNYRPRYNRRSCLTREWSGSIDPVTSTDMLNRLMANSRSYDTFRVNLERDPHSAVHVNIGGDMGEMISPSDPVFFLHHAMVDKIWNDWQKLRPDNMRAYNGNQDGWQNFRGGRAATNHILYPYNDWTVADTFDTEALCFRYRNLNLRDVRAAELPPPTVTPSQPTTPISQPTQPSRPTTPINVPPPRTNDDDRRRRDDDDDRRRRDDDDDDRRHHSSTGKKIKKFFKDLFNDGAVDPSQAPIGSSGPKVEPAPVDNKVKLDFKEDAPAAFVDYKDRSELIKLRPVKPLPEAWLKLNKLDVAETRKYEEEERKELQKLNNVFGYISPSALWNQADKIAALAKTGVQKFEATLSSVVVTVENSAEEVAKDALQAVSNIHARVKMSIGFTRIQNIEKVKPQVTKIIGEEVYAKDTVSNPYHPRHKADVSAPATPAAGATAPATPAK
jgi:tyrosinase